MEGHGSFNSSNYSSGRMVSLLLCAAPNWFHYCCYRLILFLRTKQFEIIFFTFATVMNFRGNFIIFLLEKIDLKITDSGDLASILGCMIGLKDAITAISLVALGTSLPDMFASKISAQNVC